MDKLTVEQLVVENFPLRIESYEQDFNCIFQPRELREINSIYDRLCQCFFLCRIHRLKDETIVGIKEIKELFSFMEKLCCRKFVYFLNLLEEINSMSRKDVLKIFNEILKNFHDLEEISLSKKERKAILKIFREPYSYLEEIEKLYDIVLYENSDIVKSSGINFEISPVTTLYTIKNTKISTKQKVALLYFTNVNWYGKKVAPILFLAISSCLRDISTETLLRNTNRFFWDKIRNHIKTFVDFYRRKLLISSLIGEHSLFEICCLSFLLSFGKAFSGDIENFRKLIQKTRG